MKEVKMYSTPTCHYCHIAEAFFAENNIAFTKYDVSTDVEKRAEMMDKTGQMGVPVIMIGEKIVIGFNEAKIREFLAEEDTQEEAPMAQAA